MQENSKQVALDILKTKMQQNLIEAKQNYENTTFAERIDYVSNTMNLVKDYCSLLWGLDPNMISTGFDKGAYCRAHKNDDNVYDKFMLRYSYLGAMTHQPKVIYKTCFHEMRHVYQRLFKDNNRAYYTVVPEQYKNLHQVAWLGSNIEQDADNFAFKETIGILKGAAKEEGQVVKPCDVKTFQQAHIKNQFSHLFYRPAAYLIGNSFAFLNSISKQNNQEQEFTDNSLTVEQMKFLVNKNDGIFERSCRLSQGKNDVVKEADETLGFIYSVDKNELETEMQIVQDKEALSEYQDTQTENVDSAQSEVYTEQQNTLENNTSVEQQEAFVTDTTKQVNVTETQAAAPEAQPVAECTME